MNRLLASLLLLLPLVAPASALALASDRDEPIHIRADRVEINEQTGVSIYRGNVEVRQGSMLLQANRVIVYRKGDELDRLEAEGQPARFRQRPDEGEPPVQGSAQHIEYHASTATAYLVGDGYMQRGRNEFRGERIEYDTAASIVKATGGGEGDGRVHAVIRPKTEAPSE